MRVAHGREIFPRYPPTESISSSRGWNKGPPFGSACRSILQKTPTIGILAHRGAASKGGANRPAAIQPGGGVNFRAGAVAGLAGHSGRAGQKPRDDRAGQVCASSSAKAVRGGGRFFLLWEFF